MLTPLDILPKNYCYKHIIAGAPKDYSLCTAAPSPERKMFSQGRGRAVYRLKDQCAASPRWSQE